MNMYRAHAYSVRERCIRRHDVLQHCTTHRLLGNSTISVFLFFRLVTFQLTRIIPRLVVAVVCLTRPDSRKRQSPTGWIRTIANYSRPRIYRVFAFSGNLIIQYIDRGISAYLLSLGFKYIFWTYNIGAHKYWLCVRVFSNIEMNRVNWRDHRSLGKKIDDFF